MSITSLPNDIIYEIIRRLPIAEILSFCTINKHFNKVCNNPNLWLILILDFDPTIKDSISNPKHYYLRHLHFAGPIVIHDVSYSVFGRHTINTYNHKIISQNTYIAKRDLIKYVESILDIYRSFTAYYMQLKITINDYDFSTIIIQDAGPTSKDPQLIKLLDHVHQIDIINRNNHEIIKYIDESSQSLAIFKNYVRERQRKLYFDAINRPNFGIATSELSLEQRKQRLWNNIIDNSRRLNFKIDSTNHKVRVLGFWTYDDFVIFQRNYIQNMSSDQVALIESIVNNVKLSISGKYKKEDNVHHSTLVFNKLGQFVMVNLEKNDKEIRNNHTFFNF